MKPVRYSVLGPGDPPTSKQLEVLETIEKFRAKHGISPTTGELAEILEVSPMAVHARLLKLQLRGLVRRIPKSPRSLAVTDAGHERLRRSA